jgi:hypothetical protein
MAEDVRLFSEVPPELAECIVYLEFRLITIVDGGYGQKAA